MCFCVADDDYYEDDEEDDPDALKDPLYQIDLQVRSFWMLFILENGLKCKVKLMPMWLRNIQFS